MANRRQAVDVKAMVAHLETLAANGFEERKDERSAQVVRSAVRFADSLFQKMGNVHWNWSTELAFERELSKAISDHLAPGMGEYDAMELALAWLVEREKEWQTYRAGTAIHGAERSKQLAKALHDMAARKHAYDWVSTFCG